MGEVGPAGPQLGQERDVGGATLDRSAALARTTAAALAVAFGVIGLGMLLRLVADDAQARAASGAAGARHDGAGVGAGPN